MSHSPWVLLSLASVGLTISAPLPGLLWNLSSTDELKEELVADALPVLADRVIIPFSGWCDGNSNMSRDVVDPEVFFNATGCLRSDGRRMHGFFVPQLQTLARPLLVCQHPARAEGITYSLALAVGAGTGTRGPRQC